MKTWEAQSEATGGTTLSLLEEGKTIGIMLTISHTLLSVGVLGPFSRKRGLTLIAAMHLKKQNLIVQNNGEILRVAVSQRIRRYMQRFGA